MACLRSNAFTTERMGSRPAGMSPKSVFFLKGESLEVKYLTSRISIHSTAAGWKNLRFVVSLFTYSCFLDRLWIVTV